MVDMAALWDSRSEVLRNPVLFSGDLDLVTVEVQLFGKVELLACPPNPTTNR